MTRLNVGVAHQIERQGQWLFHRRSRVGLAVLPALALALWQPGFPATTLSPAQLNMLAVIGLVISLAGLILRWITVATVPADTSRRSTRQQSARSLNTLGMYSIVRHPLYLANAVVVSGFVVAVGSVWFFLVFQLAHALYVERVMACEDRFLAHTHDDAWEHWALRTPSFLPRLKLWKGNPLGCSVRTILRREYNGVFGVALAFFALQGYRGVIVGHQAFSHWAEHHVFWSAVLATGLLALLVLRTLKRHTRLLHVAGR